MFVRSEIILLLDIALGQTARLRKGGTEATYFCPFCKSSKRKMECCLDEHSKFIGVFHCWTCSTSGTFSKLLLSIHASPSLRDRLYGLTKDIKFQPREDAETETLISLPPEFHPMRIPEKTPEYKNALAYLKRRGVTREDILRYNIGFCESGAYEQHIIIPSYDAAGELNFFIGRRYYINEFGFRHKKPDVSMDVVGFEIFINWKEPLNLVEGVFDAFAVRNNAIPLFGKYPSPTLRTKMNEFHVKHVNVILDWDAWDDAIKMYKRLRKEVPTLTEIHLVALNGKDPSELGFDQTHALIQASPEFDEMDLVKYDLQL